MISDSDPNAIHARRMRAPEKEERGKKKRKSSSRNFKKSTVKRAKSTTGLTGEGPSLVVCSTILDFE